MSQPDIREVKKCRVCGFAPLKPIISLGDLYVTNFVEDTGAEIAKSPLDVVLCDEEAGGCSLLQLKHTYSEDKLYTDQYWYRSGINRTMTEELQGMARKIQEMADLKEGDYVIDTGSNDSTLLRGYTHKGVQTIGFEPAKNLMDLARPGITEVINDFFNKEAWDKKYEGQKAKVITSIAMFYDLDDPNKFVADVASLLDEDGIWVVQQNYLPLMLEHNVFDNVSHEHLEYYSLHSFEALLKRHNLEVFDIELNNVNGGSMRTYIRHQGKGAGIRIDAGAEERLTEIRTKESQMKLNHAEPYLEFAKRVEGIKEKISTFVKDEVKKGKKVHVYGASTRGNTLLQYCGLDHTLIEAAAERNPIKWGKKTVGTNIPIISEEESRAAKPDYFLVLPWQFLEEFIEREGEFLENGGKFIAPLPEFKVIIAGGAVIS